MTSLTLVTWAPVPGAASFWQPWELGWSCESPRVGSLDSVLCLLSVPQFLLSPHRGSASSPPGTEFEPLKEVCCLLMGESLSPPSPVDPKLFFLAVTVILMMTRRQRAYPREITSFSAYTESCPYYLLTSDPWNSSWLPRGLSFPI